MDALRHQTDAERKERARAAFRVSENIAQEREGIVNQVYLFLKLIFFGYVMFSKYLIAMYFLYYSIIYISCTLYNCTYGNAIEGACVKRYVNSPNDL